MNFSTEDDVYEGAEFQPKVFETLGMHLHGELITTRIVLHKDAFCEVVLDHNTYLGYDDFEIEVEFVDEYEWMATEHLKSIAELLIKENLIDSVESFILRVGKDKAKSERFFEKKRIEGR